MSPYRTIIQWITPPEARPIADALFAIADEVKLISNQVEGVGSNLEGSWRGTAKNIFFSHYDSLPGELDRFASSLEAKAGAVAAISIWIEIMEWFDDLIPG